MEEEKGLINFEDISKPVTALIEKLANGAGILYEPTKIRREAKAQAEAKKIHALTDLEIQDIQKRALERFIKEETIKQKNIEDVTEKTFKKLDKSAKPENIDNDWISNFFDKVKFISDEEVQELWSKLLAGEANQPGTYSKRTIEIISLLDKKDAILFNNLCTFFWFDGANAMPLIYRHEDEIYNKKNINFNALLHLQDIGLIQFGGLPSFSRINFPKKFTFYYYHKTVNVEFLNDKDNQLDVGKVMLTTTGKELYSICNSKFDNDFYLYILDNWKKKGLKIQEL